MPSCRTLRTTLLAVLAPFALAAQDSMADSEQQRRRAKEEAEQRQRLQEAPSVHLPAPPVPTEDDRDLRLPEETPSFPIDRFELEVPAHLWKAAGIQAPGQAGRFRFAQRYLDRYRGRGIGPEGIRLIMRRLTRRILTRGYTTTRLDLPGQDLATGTLKLTLVPGVVHGVRFAGPAPRGSWRAPFPVRPGTLLNVRDLEQGLEQMKRLPSQDVAISIVPGPRLGDSDVLLTVRQGRPWRAAVAVDDSGLSGTGRWQGTTQVAWDNPLGCSDQLTGFWSHDVTRHKKGSGTQAAGLTYALPLGRWTFQAGWSQHAYVQQVPGAVQRLEYSGVSRSLDARVSYVFHRNQTTKDSLQLRVGNRTSRAFLVGSEIADQRRQASTWELSLTRSQVLGRARLDVTAGHRRGVSWFGALPDLDGPDQPTSYYRVQTLDATLGVPLRLGRRRLHYSATLHAQHSGHRLYAAEHLALGSRWTVRGFDGDRTLGGERGAFLRNDLEIPVGSGTTLFLGLDAGRVGGPSTRHLAGRSLAGAALGVKGRLGRGLAYQVFAGGPLHCPPGFSKRWPVLGVSASLGF